MVEVIAQGALCRHCEQQPQAGRFGLCEECRAMKGIERRYVRRRGWSPAWEAHLVQLRRRAEAHLPLFAGGVYLGPPMGRNGRPLDRILSHAENEQRCHLSKEGQRRD